MEVIGYDPFLTAELAETLKKEVTVNNNLDEIFPVADYITVHVPLTPKQKSLSAQPTLTR